MVLSVFANQKIAIYQLLGGLLRRRPCTTLRPSGCAWRGHQADGEACPAKPLGEDGQIDFPDSTVKQLAVIASAREAIHNLVRLDCLRLRARVLRRTHAPHSPRSERRGVVAIAPRNDALRRSRGAIRARVVEQGPRKQRAQEKPDASRAPAASRPKTKSTRVSHHRSTETIRLFPRDWF
jgi:hypothetical protein